MNRTWTAVRVGFAALGLWSGYEWSGGEMDVPWYMPIAFFVVAPLMVLASRTFQGRNGTKWERPSWGDNPFQSQLQFCHMVVWQLIVGGVVAIAIPLLLGENPTPWHFQPLTFGIGALLGIRLVTRPSGASP